MASASARLKTVQPICSMCPHHCGFAGPSHAITLCRHNGKKQRIAICSSICPEKYWDCRDLGKPPVVSDRLPLRELCRKDDLSGLKDCGRGEILLIFANGPSHRESGLESMVGGPRDASPRISTMMVGRPWEAIWPTDYWVFADQSRIRHDRQTWRDFPNTILTTVREEIHPRAILLRGSGKFEMDLSRGKARVGGSSTLLAMQLALWMGFDHIYIVGLDMSRDGNGKLYPWGSNPCVGDGKRIARFASENDEFEKAAQVMGALKSRFTLCSSYLIKSAWPFASHFDTVDHRGAADLIRSRHQQSNAPAQPLAGPTAGPSARPASRPSLSLITCTGNRPEAFALCERWMRRELERFDGPIQWIVVDDGQEPTACTMGQQVIRAEPRPGENTQARNMNLALNAIRYDRFLIREDDDWYHPDYLHTMASLLDRYDAVGEGLARKYNVRLRRWRQFDNLKHACACRMGLHRRLIPQLRCSLASARLFDMHFWRSKPPNGHVFTGRNLCVGIKSMPGRGGIDGGHHPDHSYAGDPDMSILRQWIGDDADAYAPYYVPGTAGVDIPTATALPV